MKTPITLQQDAHLESGTYRLPTEDGKQSIYVLDGAWYQAPATDDQGNEYTVFWTIREDYDPDGGDESDACDWGTPRAVVCGGNDVTGNVQIAF